MRFLQLLLLFFLSLSYAKCAKILGIFHVAGRSHYQAGSALMKILAENRHEVTVVSPFGEKTPPKNYRDVVMEGVMEEHQKQKMNFFELKMNPFVSRLVFTFISGKMVDNIFKSKNVQKLMNSGEHFDLVIIEQFGSQAAKYIAHHFNAPLVEYTALEANDWVNPYHGNPDNPSYVPGLMLDYNSEMNFCQRVTNTILYTVMSIVRVVFDLPYQNIILHRYFPNAPHLNEISSNVSLVLVNTNPSTHDPLPRVPSLIDIGGFHIRKPKSLPKDLQEMLDKAENGVVYFSMGSNLKSKDMPEKRREIFLRTFAKLKETVLWKFEDDNLPGKPDNVIIMNWLPQNDVLAHKNVKLFITHGGIFSTLEAVYHELPILAIPIMGDQKPNALRAVDKGYARYLDFDTMTAEELEVSLMDLLTNPKYTEKAKYASKIMRDRPMTPQETVNFWVNYVIRHKGADHLRVASLKLSWYQYLLLDVIVFITLALVVFLALCVYISKKLYGIFTNKKQFKIKDN